MVITNAATGDPNVKALVYINAFIPAQGDTAFGLTAAQPGSHVIPPAEQLFMSKRANAHITEINSGHLSLISHPGAVARVIVAAAQATG
jgi:hypothetical protein